MKVNLNKFTIAISIAVLIIIVIIGLVLTGFYPIAFVGIKPITWHNFTENSAAAYHYYKTTLQTYGGSQEDLNKPENIQEINRAVLDKLIENEIIFKSLNSIPEANEIVRNKIEQALKQAINPKDNIKEAVNTLYGLTVDEFTKLVLVPQARKEVLEGRFFLENSSNSNGFDEWLKKAKKDAKVLILLNDFEWDGEKVVLKK